MIRIEDVRASKIVSAEILNEQKFCWKRNETSNNTIATISTETNKQTNKQNRNNVLLFGQTLQVEPFTAVNVRWTVKIKPLFHSKGKKYEVPLILFFYLKFYKKPL